MVTDDYRHEHRRAAGLCATAAEEPRGIYERFMNGRCPVIELRVPVVSVSSPSLFVRARQAKGNDRSSPLAG
jgi:hypothetical protein